MSAVGGDGARLSDGELASRALEGCADAWDELARRHTRRVIVSLLARGTPLDLAEDLAQEAWLRLIQQQRAGRLVELRLPGLAIAQAQWLARDVARTRMRREVLSGATVRSAGSPGPIAFDSGAVDPASDPEEVASLRERIETIRTELARCPARAQQVFQEVYGPRQGTHAEVAEELGLSVQRVRQILCETRARLRRALTEREGGSVP